MAVCVPHLPKGPRPQPPPREAPPPMEMDSTERIQVARRQLEARFPSYLFGQTVLRPRSKAMWETKMRRAHTRVRFPKMVLPPPSEESSSSKNILSKYGSNSMSLSTYAHSLSNQGPSQIHRLQVDPRFESVQRYGTMPPPMFQSKGGDASRLSSFAALGPCSRNLKASFVKKLTEGECGSHWSAAWGGAVPEYPVNESADTICTPTAGVPPAPPTTPDPSAPTSTPIPRYTPSSTGVRRGSAVSGVSASGLSPIGPFLQAPFPVLGAEPGTEGGLNDIPVRDSRPSVRWGWSSSARSLLRRTSAWLKPRSTLKRCPRRFPSHSVYDGDWHMMLRTFDGHGRLRLPNKVEYEGTFMDGMCHGEGALIYPNGAMVQATWNKGRIVEMTYKAANAAIYDPNGNYCRMPDRRFHHEILYGLQPACRSLLTDEPPPARPIPPGCYDAGDGVFDPSTNVVYDPNTITVVRVPTTEERKWIMKNCRKGWDEKVGLRPDLYERWVDEPEPVGPMTEDRQSTRSASITSGPHFKMERQTSPSLDSGDLVDEEPPDTAPPMPDLEPELLPEPEQEPEPEPEQRLLERLEDRFLQEDYPPAFTEDVIIRAPPPRQIDEMLFPEPEVEPVSSDEEDEVSVMSDTLTGARRVAAAADAARLEAQLQKKPMTERERKMALKAARLRDQMSEEEKRAEMEREAEAKQLRRLERDRLRRLREARTSPWATAAKLMMPVLEESILERQERRRLMEESAAKEEMRRKEREEVMQLAKQAAAAAAEERARAEAEKLAEAEADAEARAKARKMEYQKLLKPTEEEEYPPTPRLSLDESERQQDEYSGPWRHVAKRLVPHLRERIEDDRQAAAAKWQEDLMQLLTERASVAGLEMSTSGFLGATAPPVPEERKRGSSIRIFPPGLEERARRRRAEREAREMEEAKEFAAEQRAAGHGSMSSIQPSPSQASVSSEMSRGSVKMDAPRRSVSMAPTDAARKSLASRRVSINTDAPFEQEGDDMEHRKSGPGPTPTLRGREKK